MGDHKAPSSQLYFRYNHFYSSPDSICNLYRKLSSFLGLGVNAPMPSLGSLASDALNGMYSYPSRLIIPAIMISLIVLSLNLFGDGLRDAFDPKLNG